jgi:hypothetical protein
MMNTENKYFVYTYSYPDGIPFYVGKGCNNRHLVHLQEAKLNKNLNSYKIKVIKKILKNNQLPIIKKIIENVDEELAFLVEEEYISKYGRRDIGTGILVNCTSGGDGSSDLSEETRKKKSLAVTGSKNPFYGKKHTSETFAKINAANTGRFVPEDVRLKHKIAMEGKHTGEENPFYGKKHTPETKSKMAQSRLKFHENLISSGVDHFNKNRKVTEETLLKLRVERTCPHCNKTGKGSAMHRWHFDNCKIKV